MLVIGRRAGQAFRIGRDIVVGVREIRNQRVKLTISAPPGLTILRAEVEEEPVYDEAHGSGRPGRQGGCEHTDGS